MFLLEINSENFTSRITKEGAFRKYKLKEESNIDHGMITSMQIQDLFQLPTKDLKYKIRGQEPTVQERMEIGKSLKTISKLSREYFVLTK